MLVVLENLFYLCDIGYYSALTEKPVDTILHPGDSLRLNCASDVAGTPVAWSFNKDGSHEPQMMTVGSDLISDFNELFTIDYSSNGYNLEAKTPEDIKPYCGKYTCGDSNGDHGDESADAYVSSKCKIFNTPLAIKKLYPLYLTHVAVVTVCYESRNNENVILQQDITKENRPSIKCIIASSKWTRVMCLIFTYLGCYAAKTLIICENA